MKSVEKIKSQIDSHKADLAKLKKALKKDYAIINGTSKNKKVSVKTAQKNSAYRNKVFNSTVYAIRKLELELEYLTKTQYM
jgi:ABC-type Fe3+-citrate transport system substrate-binding protein